MPPSVAIVGTRGYASFHGGFETAVRHLAPFLADVGWDVSVYSREAPPTTATVDPRVDVVRTGSSDLTSLGTISHGPTSVTHLCRSRAEDYYSWEGACHSYRNLLEKVAG